MMIRCNAKVSNDKVAGADIATTLVAISAPAPFSAPPPFPRREKYPQLPPHHVEGESPGIQSDLYIAALHRRIRIVRRSRKSPRRVKRRLIQSMRRLAFEAFDPCI